MPLAATFNLQWYGEASMASFVNEATATVTAGIAGTGRIGGSSSGSATITNADATRLVNSPATITASATITNALPKGRARPTASISIGSRPTAEDIAQAVWGSATTITTQAGSMARAMKVMSAIAANRVVTNPSTGKFIVYDDDNTTILVQGDLWQDAAGTTAYSGAGAERRDKLA